MGHGEFPRVQLPEAAPLLGLLPEPWDGELWGKQHAEFYMVKQKRWELLIK